MKFQLVSVSSSKAPWLEDQYRDYQKKMARFAELRWRILKAKPGSTRDPQKKVQLEREILVSQVDRKFTNILFDNSGMSFSDSEDFARTLQRQIDFGRPIQFFVGGAFGFDENDWKSFDEVWSLSGLTFNHHLAQLMALEQIYRGLTILNSHPYHKVPST